jgi:signal transduction histidine kinase
MFTKAPQLTSRAMRAHAMKNCLAIVGAVNKLIEPEVSEAVRERLSRSQIAVRRMVELIGDDLLPDSESFAPRAAEPVTAACVLGAVRARVQDLAHVRGVRLIFQVGTGSVCGDADDLAEALGNLVANAIQSSPPGAAVVVTSARTADGRQLWTVRDDGPGMPRHVLAHVGAPFFSRRQGGSGLGVAVSRETIERHGGLVQFESEPGVGTRVSIQLPCHSASGDARRVHCTSGSP